jgi:two-component system, sensor histidine kinase and response regulator
MNDRASSHRAGQQVPAFAPAIGLREVLEASPDLVFCCDAWGRFAWVSSAFEHVAGWRASELVGQPFTKLLPEAERAGAVRTHLRQRRRSRAVAERHLSLLRPDGSTIALTARVRLYERPDGDAYFVGIARERAAEAVAPAAPAPAPAAAPDTFAEEAMAAASATIADAVAARTVAEDRLRTLQAQFEETRAQSQLKGEFLAALSHEVRTPVLGMIDLAHRLLTSGLASEPRQMTEYLLESGQRLMTLVSDAIDYARVESGGMPAANIDFDLRVAMEQVASGLQPAADTRGIGFEAHVAAFVPSRLKGDPGRLRQVLLSLGHAALQQPRTGHVALRVEREREDDTHVALVFRLETAASAGADITSIAGPASGSPVGSGSALALAISRRLVERMGGQMDADASTGFRITFEKQAHAVVPPTANDVQLRGLRVLVADGTEREREATSEVLAAWGVTADTAGNGAEALQMLRQAAAQGQPYSVAVVDLQLEGLDGEALGAAVRADSDLDATLLVLTTRFGRPGDAERMKAMGFSAYLVKPIEVSQLFDTLTEVLGAQHAQIPPAERPLVTRHSLAEAKRGRLRILLVEDDAVNQLVTQSALNRVGYNVEVASNGRAAIELTENGHWDLILMDTQMPGLDGYRATEAIRARERGSSRTPILGLTGDSAFRTDRERCLAAGMDDVFRKPIDLAELTTAVERWTVRSDIRPGEPVPAPADEAGHAPRFAVVSSHFEPPAGAEGAAEAKASGGELVLPEGPAIDLEQLNTASMGLPALRTSLLHTYLDDVYPRLERLQAAIDSGNAHRVEFEAHGLRGMCATIGAAACTMLFGEMESLAREERVDETRQYLEPARAEVGRTEEFIQRLERMVMRDAA